MMEYPGKGVGFGRLLQWHLRDYGTRPDGHPSAATGRIWEFSEFCGKANMEERRLRYWRKNTHLPGSTSAIEKILFGDNIETKYDPWRVDLREALSETKADNERKAALKKGRAVPEQEAGVDSISADQDVEADEPEEIPPEKNDRADESFGESNLQPERSIADAGVPAIRGAETENDKVNLPPPRSSQISYRGRAMAAAMMCVAIGGYVTIKHLSKPIVVVDVPINPPKPDPEEKPPVQTPTRPESKTDAPSPSPTKQVTEEEKRAAEEQRARMQAMLAKEEGQRRQAANERQAAIDRNDAQQKAERSQLERDDNARRLASMGFNYIENNTMRGRGLPPVQAESVTDCALACLRDNCDGFAYAQNEVVTELRKGRSCLRFKGDIEFDVRPGYSAAKRSDLITLLRFAANGNIASDGPWFVAQAGSTPPMDADGVIRCPNGPVKVSGYNLTCDVYLGGGTTLGSAQLIHSVTTINECAAKCSAVKACTAFTFNAADQPGKRRCEIFGGKPEMRTVGGWVSGER